MKLTKKFLKILKILEIRENEEYDIIKDMGGGGWGDKLQIRSSAFMGVRIEICVIVEHGVKIGLNCYCGGEDWGT